MASRRLSKSASAAIKAHYAFSRPSLLFRSRAISASNPFLLQANSFIGVSENGFTSHGQLLPLSFQFPSLRCFSDTADQVRVWLHVDFQFSSVLLVDTDSICRLDWLLSRLSLVDGDYLSFCLLVIIY